MDVWFEAAQAKFEIFLEQKLEIYGQSVAALGPISEEAAVVGENLKALPDTFLDAIHEMIEKTYIELPNGYDVTPEESEGCPSALYGELTSFGVRRMVEMMKECGATAPITVDGVETPAVFLDLGSGTGKVPIEVALRAPEMDTAGVEFVQSRNDVGTVALTLMAQEDASASSGLKKKVSLLCGDFLQLPTVDVCKRVTSIFCCGVGFEEDFCGTICDRILADFPNVKMCLLLFRSPPPHELVLPVGGKTVTLESIHTTWMDETPAMLVKFNR